MEHQEFVGLAETLLFSKEFGELQDALTLREPNLWHILAIPDNENRISRFLAWLLNPKADHSLGAHFLKELLVQTLRTEIGRRHSLTPVDILVKDLSEANVQTEYRFSTNRRCDIVISAEAGERTNGFVCLIENKVKASEGYNQTLDYYQLSFEAFPAERYSDRIYIYLSPDGDPPQSEHFIPLSYPDVLSVLEKILGKHQLTRTEQFLLQQFQENILRGIAMASKTVDLALAIYEQHKAVFDFVMRCVNQDQVISPPGPDRVWDGHSRFINVGENIDSGYKWVDYRRYGFICAGGGPRYRSLMEQFNEGDTVYAYVSKFGYVGIGTVDKKAVPFRQAVLADGRRLAEVDLEGQYNGSENDNLCDWIALVDWKYAVGKEQAVRQQPITPATACKIYDNWDELTEQVRAELAQKAALGD